MRIRTEGLIAARLVGEESGEWSCLLKHRLCMGVMSTC